MVLIRSLKFAGLFSYPEEAELEFSNRMVVVGPNNSGKSNIIRILNLIVETFSKGRLLLESDISRGGTNPFSEMKLELSREETGKIIDFFSFYTRPPNNYSAYFDFTNREFLLNKLDHISIKISWQRVVHRYGSQPYLELEFEKLGLIVSGHIHSSSAVVSNKSPAIRDNCPIRQDIKLHEILAKLSDRDNPKEIISKIFDSTENQFLGIGNIQYNQSELMNDKDKLAFVELFSYMGVMMENTQISITTLLGRILKRSFHYTKGGVSTYDLLDLVGNLQTFAKDDFDIKLRERTTSYLLEHVDELKNDGNNLPQFLFHLKNSPNYTDANKFRKIQAAFNEIVKSEDLSMDVALEYEKTMSHVIWGEKEPQKPKRPIVLISDMKLGNHFPLEQVGTGLAEVIYLLAASYGLKDSVIMLDEPAVNLHPTMVKALMKYIENPENRNQFLTITHSADLLNYELFEGEAVVFYVRKSNQVSRIKSLKDELKIQFKKDLPRLKHQIDNRIFFAKSIVLTEGESDRHLLNGISQCLGSTNPDLDIERNDVIITSVDGKKNFRKYRDLLDAFEIPYVILADSEARNLFESYGTVTKDGVKGNDEILVIENGDLEQLMRDIDSATYSKIEREVGNSKPTVAFLFTQEIMSKNPDVLKSLTPILQNAIKKSHK